MGEIESPSRPRTTYQQIEGFRSLIRTEATFAIATDVIQNSRELAPNVDWPFILNHVQTVNFLQERVRGTAAVGRMIASTVGSISKKMRWNMDRPEIVYMGGEFFNWIINKEAYTLERYIGEAKEGKKQFLTPEHKDKYISDKSREVGKLRVFSKRIREKLDSFAEGNFAGNEKYRAILKELIFSGLNPVLSRSTVEKVMKLMREEKIDEAYDLIQPREKTKSLAT